MKHRGDLRVAPHFFNIERCGKLVIMDKPLEPKDHVFYIPVEKIVPNPYQPRKEFDPEALKHLAASIREYGILQPLVVSRLEIESPTGGIQVQYELIAGERRHRASQLAGLKEVPAIIRRQESPKVKLELALIENLQREDLNPIERALAYRQLVDQFEMSQRQVADRIGKSREVVANTLRLLNLPEVMREALAGGKINEGHTRPLLMVTDYPEAQANLFHDILEKQLSVRQAEEIARNIAIERSKKLRTPSDPNIKEVEDKLGNQLGAKVSVHKDKNGHGRIAIEFYSDEEMFGIAARMSELAASLGHAMVTATPTSEVTTEPLAAQEASPEAPAEVMADNVAPSVELAATDIGSITVTAPEVEVAESPMFTPTPSIVPQEEAPHEEASPMAESVLATEKEEGPAIAQASQPEVAPAKHDEPDEFASFTL